MAAIHHPQLETAQRNFSYINTVALGTYCTETGTLELLLPPVVSLRPPKYFQPIFPSLDWDNLDITSGMTVPVESICQIVRFDRVILQLDGDLGSSMFNVRQKFNILMEQYQSQCENNPPVVRPIIGMAVAVNYRETEMWCRAEVVDTQEIETTVRYVDYGYLVAIRDSEFSREIPSEWRYFSSMAVELELSVHPVEKNKDILYALMIESILSYPEKCLVLVEEVTGGGKLRGQLVSLERELIYRGLVREGVIKVV